ncbi:MAG: FlgD immunoglobulin-like domain containing protein, partial [Candidatus Eisenbacteria bacterium]|nr:FlgD immunoglobulin-like domain containing protein [Candidatus Eisenbacteria bacterium]
GRHVRTLASALHQPGRFNLSWDGKDDGGQVVASGVYVYQLRSGASVLTRKMLLLR